MKTYQEPVITRDDSKDVEIETHPAYGVIGISRVTANPGVSLMGSDFKHGSFLTLRVYHGELKRTLHRDWHHARELVLEVALSEAQWATLVSTPNHGDGTTCTLEFANNERLPGIARPRQTYKRFTEEADKSLEDVRKRVETIREMVENLPMSKKLKEQFFSEFTKLKNDLGPNLDYLSKTFSEHMEAGAAKAKTEINAYIANRIHDAGLQALTPGHKPLELTEGEVVDANSAENHD